MGRKKKQPVYTQTTLFPLADIVAEKKYYTLQERSRLILERCDDDVPANPYPKLRDMLADVRKRYDNNELPWQKKEEVGVIPMINA